MKLDRILLVVYIVTSLGLLLYPIAGPSRDLLGIGTDKWLHLLLFAGLAVFLRWSAAQYSYPNAITILAAFLFAFATEAAQGLVVYRSADFWDVIAGLVGAMIATAGIDRLMALPKPERPLGVIIIGAGLIMSTLFLVADIIGVGSNDFFGITQLVGTLVGCGITLGGIVVYRSGNHVKTVS